MADDEGSFSNKSSPYNSESEENIDEQPKKQTRPDLGIEDFKYIPPSQDDSGVGDCSGFNAKSTTSGVRKEESPFSFRHFLKRDLSLPGSTSSETTSRPKVYANTVQHSPTRRRADGARTVFSVPQNSSTSHDCATKDDTNRYRPNMGQETLGIPSLPDFVQDHLLVEQVYLNNEGPLSVDLDNLPDFTLNSDVSSRNGYDYELGHSSSNERDVESSPSPNPLDLPLHLNLDLTESVNPADRRNNSPHNSFPLDLPANAALPPGQSVESMRLPDFLPVLAGRQSPESPDADREIARLSSELDNVRSELISERSRSQNLQAELESAVVMQEALREELRMTRQNNASNSSHSCKENNTDTNECVKQLKRQVLQLQDELIAARNEVQTLRAEQQESADSVRQTAAEAGNRLREVLESLEKLKTTGRELDDNT